MERDRERREYREFRDELYAGIVAAAVANFSFGAPKKPLTAAHFMPSQRERMEREQAKKSKRFNRKDAVASVGSFLRAAMQNQEKTG